MSKVLAIDPGTEQSGVVLYDWVEHKVLKRLIVPNEDVRELIIDLEHEALAIEMIASYGMPVGKSTFETCLWIGRFVERSWDVNGIAAVMVYRREVKGFLCAGNAKAKDKNIMAAIKDKFAASGGGANPTVGVKKNPGPLFGVSSHMWAALGVALTWANAQGYAIPEQEFKTELFN